MIELSNFISFISEKDTTGVSFRNSFDEWPIVQERRKDENEDSKEIAPLNQEYHDNHGKLISTLVT